MQKITVVFVVLLSFTFGDWQPTGEVALPKGAQISDFSISRNGNVWFVSPTAVFQLEPNSKTTQVVSSLQNGRLIAAGDSTLFILNESGRLASKNLKNETDIAPAVQLGNASRLRTVQVEGRTALVGLEPGQLVFVDEGKVTAVLPLEADKIAVLPAGDYGTATTPIFTLNANRIYAWTGGLFSRPEDYRSRIIYSSSGSILDIAADDAGRLFILFSDSVVVLDNDGNRRERIAIESVPPGSGVSVNPANSALVVFNKTARTLTLIGELKKDNGALITLEKNTPNPVDNYTEIEFSLGKSLAITLTIYNLIGEPVKTLTGGQFGKGRHRVSWNARDEKGNIVPNGIYFYRLESSKGVAIKQLVVLR